MKTEISSYEQQAIDFLTATKTTLTTDFKEFNSMAWDKDGQKRNIFTVTLLNDRHKYSFDFGSSLKDSLKQTPIIYSKEATEIYYGFSHGKDRKIYFGFKIKTDYPTLLQIKESKGYNSIINENDLKNAFLDYELEVNTHNKKNKYDSFVGMSYDRILLAIRQRIADAIIQAEKQSTLVERADTIVHPTAYDILACITKYEVGTFEDFCSNFGYDTDSRSALKTYKSVRKEWNNVSKLFTESELEQLQEIN